jgi:hypothetical protein
MSLTPCKFYIGDSKKGLTYDEMRQYLLDNYDTLVAPSPSSKQRVVEERKAPNKAEQEMEKKLKQIPKPDVSVPVLSNKDLVDSKDPIGNRAKLAEIQGRQKELQRLINCLWA